MSTTHPSLLALLQDPPPPEWWRAELDRLLAVFDEKLRSPGYVPARLRERIAQAGCMDGMDLDDLAIQLRRRFGSDTSMSEPVMRLDVVVAQLGGVAATLHLGQHVARLLRSAMPPSAHP